MPLSADDQAERNSSLGAVGRRFCEKLMRSPRASNGNRAGVFQPPVTMAKSKALKHRLIQFNGPRYISYLVFDIDRPAAMLAWQDANLPRPTLIIENPRNTFAHYAYELATPVRLDNKRAANLGHAIHEAMREALEADPNYRGNLTKNPFHRDWRAETHDHAYTLTDLAEDLDFDRRARPAERRDIGDVSHSRNLTLREWLRLWAYANVRCYTDPSSFEIALIDQANAFNERSSLPTREAGSNDMRSPSGSGASEAGFGIATRKVSFNRVIRVSGLVSSIFQHPYPFVNANNMVRNTQRKSES